MLYRLDNGPRMKWKTKLILARKICDKYFSHLGFLSDAGIKVHEAIMMKASSSYFFVSWKPTEMDIKKLLSLIQSGAECQWEMHLED